MKTYPKYKDSGVEWLGEVPEEWEVRPLKLCVSLMGSGGTPDTKVEDFWSDAEDNVPWVTIADITAQRIINSTLKRITPKGVASKKLSIWPKGTLLFSIYASLGQIAFAGMPLTVNQAILALIPNSCCEQDFLYRYLEHVRPSLRSLSSSNTQDNLNASKVSNLLVPLPPLPEQRAIAAFLDHEVAKIDELIAEQERLIELLAEKRQATISHAVTKGLDPNAKLKPSGVEWLGDVPEDWEVVRLKYLGTFAAGAGFPHDEQGKEGEELPFFKVNSLGKANDDDSLSIENVDTISRETATRLRAVVFPMGTIVFAKIGAALLLSRIRTTPCNSCIDNNMMGFIPSNKSSEKFIKLAMTLIRFDLISNPGTVPSLNEGQIANQQIPLPPQQEQHAIVTEIARSCSIYDSLTTAAREAIALLQERRSSLISAAVTGKIDVRGLVPDAAEAV